MKIPSGTLALKLGILAASVTASIVLISACQTTADFGIDKPIHVFMIEPGMKVRASSGDVQKAFDNLIKKHGEKVCFVDYYDKNQHKEWHRPLTMTGAVHSGAAGNRVPADPINLVMKVAFADLDESQKFFSTINPPP